MGYFGLTGGVASGKSTVAGMMAELGAKIIDADQLGHELARAPFPAHQEIVQHFGAEILDSSGEIDRRRLGPMVFADATKLRQLNAILHPRIVHRVRELVSQYQCEDPHSVIVVDAALIFEVGMGADFCKVVVAWCRPEQQIQRLIAKTGITREEAERRLAAQMPVAEKRHRADYVIDCSGSKARTRAQVQAVYGELRRALEAGNCRMKNRESEIDAPS